MTQIAFPESVNNTVHTSGVYASRGANPTSNQSDGIFSDSLASEFVTPAGSPTSGYTVTFRVGVSVYFHDELTDRVHAREPYSAHRGQRLLNSRDMIFREGGSQLILPVVGDRDGYASTFRIAVRPGQPRRDRVGQRRNSL